MIYHIYWFVIEIERQKFQHCIDPYKNILGNILRVNVIDMNSENQTDLWPLIKLLKLNVDSKM